MIAARFFLYFAVLVFVLAPAAYAQCTSPSAPTGSKEWFSGEATYKYCVGTSWVDVPVGGTDGACSTPGAWDYDTVDKFFKQCAGGVWEIIGCSSGSASLVLGSDACAYAGGVSVGGSCWLRGGYGENCDQVCANYNGTYNSTTLTYAGSAGSLAQCQNVITAMGIETTASSQSCSRGTGCTETNYGVGSSPSSFRCTSPATTSSEKYGAHKRFCACQGLPTGVATIGGGGTFFIKSGSTWTVPADWGSTNTIHVIGGGGGGGPELGVGGGGGGGGAYSRITNAVLVPGSVININVGSGGKIGQAGGDTWLYGDSCANSMVCAKGGAGASPSGSTGGAGGAAASGIGSVKYSGGNGGNGGGSSDDGGGGGGGAASPCSNGGNGGAGSSCCGGGGGGVNGAAGGAGAGAGGGGVAALGGTWCTSATGAGGAAGGSEAGDGVNGGGGGGNDGGSTSYGGIAGQGSAYYIWTQTGDGAQAGPAAAGGGGGRRGSGKDGLNYGAGASGPGEDGFSFNGTGGTGGEGIIIVEYTPSGSSCASPTGSCSSAGSLDYSSGTLQFCDGTNWLPVSGAGAQPVQWLTHLIPLKKIKGSTALSGVTVTASGGTITYSKLSGDAWLSVNSTTGAITGTSPGSSGTATIAVRATNGSTNADRTFQVLVDTVVPSWTTGTTLPGTLAGLYYETQVTATESGTPPVTYSKVSGNAAWLNVTTDGVVWATSSQVGTFNITVRATDQAGNTADRTFSVTFTGGSYKILCTHYFQRGMLTEGIMRGDLAYARQIDGQVRRAYRSWARPLLGYIEENKGGIVDRVTYFFVRNWAQEMAYRTDYAEEGSWVGAVIKAVAEPVNYVLGYFVPDDDVEKAIKQHGDAAWTLSPVEQKAQQGMDGPKAQSAK